MPYIAAILYFLTEGINVNSIELSKPPPAYSSNLEPSGRHRHILAPFPLSSFPSFVLIITTFCNFFKEHYRVTFIEYVNSIRIGHACKLLNDKKQHVAEVAYICGFKNLANFNRQFKKFKNMTPSEFKKNMKVEL